MKSGMKVISILTILTGFFFVTEAFANDIIGFHVISESSNEVVMEVSYVYDGNFGNDVAIGAYMANDGKRPDFFAYGPGKCLKGRNKVRVTLSATSNAPKQFSTNQISLSMYIGGSYSFLDKIFPYRKSWRR
jgi:hypothetical protein